MATQEESSKRGSNKISHNIPCRDGVVLRRWQVAEVRTDDAHASAGAVAVNRSSDASLSPRRQAIDRCFV